MNSDGLKLVFHSPKLAQTLKSSENVMSGEILDSWNASCDGLRWKSVYDYENRPLQFRETCQSPFHPPHRLIPSPIVECMTCVHNHPTVKQAHCCWLIVLFRPFHHELFAIDIAFALAIRRKLEKSRQSLLFD